VRIEEAPLPKWRQHWAKVRSEWRKGRDRRQKAWRTLRTAGSKAVGFAFEGAGATLISFGVHEMYRPAGYVTGGLLVWILLWSVKQDGKREGGR
jgi:hypothetical protein